MKYISTQKKLIRTQVMLTHELMREIERARRIKSESRSDYLRKAALLRLSQEKRKREELLKLADSTIGSLSMQTHPLWKDGASVEKWVKKIRNEWE